MKVQHVFAVFVLTIFAGLTKGCSDGGMANEKADEPIPATCTLSAECFYKGAPCQNVNLPFDCTYQKGAHQLWCTVKANSTPPPGCKPEFKAQCDGASCKCPNLDDPIEVECLVK